MYVLLMLAGDNPMLDSMNSRSGAGWAPEDMFKTNEEMGVKSSFDSSMHLYTTPLVRQDTEEFAQRERRAEMIAAEIERDSTSRHNTALENDDDEEAKYSAVKRPAARGSEKDLNSSPK